MDIVYRLGEASAAEIRSGLTDPPTYTTVRGLLRILVEKRQLSVRQDGNRYIYRPVISRNHAGAAMMAHIVRTFFGGSAANAASALLGSPDVTLTKSDVERLGKLVEELGEEKPAP